MISNQSECDEISGVLFLTVLINTVRHIIKLNHIYFCFSIFPILYDVFSSKITTYSLNLRKIESIFTRYLGKVCYPYRVTNCNFASQILE